MAISIGQQLGSYEITALLGKGGMGEVYRATDTKLNREVDAGEDIEKATSPSISAPRP
jgi:serine/threonine protein kinase